MDNGQIVIDNRDTVAAQRTNHSAITAGGLVYNPDEHLIPRETEYDRFFDFVSATSGRGLVLGQESFQPTRGALKSDTTAFESDHSAFQPAPEVDELDIIGETERKIREAFDEPMEDRDLPYNPERAYNVRGEILCINAAGRVSKKRVNSLHELSATIEKGRHTLESWRKGFRNPAMVEDLGGRKVTVGEEAWDTFANDSTTGYNTDAGDSSSSTFNNEYVPLMQGPWQKQLYMRDYLDMHSKCFWEYHHNPFARQVIKITTAFVMGRGVRANAENPAVQEVWDEFWDRNEMETRLPQWCDDFWRDGEIFIRIFPDGKGKIKVRTIDPSTIWDIITDPEDYEKVYYYHQQYATPMTMFTPTNIPGTEYIVRQIPGDEVIHMKINCSAAEKRGRSDIFSIMTYLKLLKDYMIAKTVQAKLRLAFVWNITAAGTTTDVNAIKINFPDVANPGSNFVHNEAIKLEAIAPNLGTGEARASDTASHLINMIAVGCGITKEFLGATDSAGTKANAVLASEPSAKKFQDRQRIVEQLLTKLKKRVMDAAQRGGLLSFKQEAKQSAIPKVISLVKSGKWAEAVTTIVNVLSRKRESEPINLTVEFTFPEIATEERSKKLQDLALAESMGWLPKEMVAPIAAKEFGITNFDVHDAFEKIKSEERLYISQQYSQTEKGVPKAPVIPFGMNPQQQPGKPGAPPANDEKKPQNPFGSDKADMKRDLKESEKSDLAKKIVLTYSS